MKKIIISIILGLYFLNCLGNISVFAELSDAQLKSIDQPIELCGENKKKVEFSIPERDLLWNKIFNIQINIYDEKDLEKNKKALDEYNKLIKENPEYSDAYFYRAKHCYQFLHSKDYIKIIEDIDTAIKFYSKNKSKYNSEAHLYNLRAKINKKIGNIKQAVEDLESVVSKGGYNDIEISCANMEEPESNEPNWTKKDFDEIINKFPSDYKGFLFRGYYYRNFAIDFFFTNEKYSSLAIKDYTNAIQLNPNFAMSYYLLAICPKASTDVVRDQFWDIDSPKKNEYCNEKIKVLNKAIALNPKFKDAFFERGITYLSLKQYENSIKDFDKVIELDSGSNDYSIYNNRGNANVSLENYDEAINDFTIAIKKFEKDCKSGIVLSGLYQSRSDAYNYVHDYNNAIKDFSKAIELILERKIDWEINISKFRTIYPEYDKVSNEALSKTVWQKLSDNPKYEDFAKRFLEENERDGFPVLALLYFNRLVAYLNAGYFKKAIAEYNRPIKTDPDFKCKIDRWWTMPNSQDRETLVDTKTWEYFSIYKNRKFSNNIYIDTKTIEYSENGSVKVWVKIVNNSSKENAEAYSLTRFEVDCPKKMINSIESISYDSSGNELQQSSENSKNNIVPESIGEMLYNGLCEDENKKLNKSMYIIGK